MIAARRLLLCTTIATVACASTPVASGPDTTAPTSIDTAPQSPTAERMHDGPRDPGSFDIDELARRLDDEDPSPDLRTLADDLASDLESRAGALLPQRANGIGDQLVVMPTPLARGRMRTAGTRQVQREIVRAATARFTGMQVRELTRRSSLESQWAIASAVVSSIRAPSDARLRRMSKGAGDAHPGPPDLLVCAWLVRMVDQTIVATAGRRIDAALVDLSPSRFDHDRIALPLRSTTIADRPRCADAAVVRTAGIGRAAALSAARLEAALEAYDARAATAARAAFERASRDADLLTPDDRDVLDNGLYLTAVRSASASPDEIKRRMGVLLDRALDAGGVAINLAFAPDSSLTTHDTPIGGRHADWIMAIARRAADAGRCLQIIAHTNPLAEGVGASPASVAMRRAVRVRRLVEASRLLPAGSVQAFARVDEGAMIGLGTADARDEWDRYIELQVAPC